MKIVIDLNKPSTIEAAITQLKAKRKELKQMQNDFFLECANWFIERANHYIALHNIGDAITAELQSSWSVFVTPKGVSIQNLHQKAAYVEFGIGVEGQGSPHPMAGYNGYNYDTPTSAKNYDGSWVFESDDSQLDTPRDKVTVIGGRLNELGGEIQYRTFIYF